MVNTLTVKKLQPAPGYLLVEPAQQEKKTARSLSSRFTRENHNMAPYSLSGEN